MKKEKDNIQGGGFLICETQADEIFISEEFTEEQKMMKKACQDFIDKEVIPHIERIDAMEEGLMYSIIQKAGKLGLLGIAIPEKYGGSGMNFNTSVLITEALGTAGSFATTYGAHTGIGTLPILYYGTEEQKQKYLPKLVNGEWISCYCLTEPNAGSDANSGKTKAMISQDGKYYSLTGQKIWISNAGFADIFIVFAKIDKDKNLTAFIVEKNFGGITMNEEERKMGIKGSSTRQVFFNDCQVPVENMLSVRENGFKIAVNILNIGRLKLGIGTIGSCKDIITKSIKYATERKQFNQPIAHFGAIKYKIAQMTILTYALEAAGHRTGGNINNKIEELITKGVPESEAKLKSAENFAIEAAILKVVGSEILSYVVDEGVQIYGGMGFSAEAPMERLYRDARIARIYEGTNEINRMLLVSMLIKKAMKGELDLFNKAMEVGKELMTIPSLDILDPSEFFAMEKHTLKNLKKAILLTAGKAAQSLGEKLREEQEILINIADMIIEVYLAESILLKVEKLVKTKGEVVCQLQCNIAKVYLHDSVEKIGRAGREAIISFAIGEEMKMLLTGIKQFTKNEPINIKNLRREIAFTMIKKGNYKLS